MLISASAIRPVKLDEVKGLAYVLPIDHWGQVILTTAVAPAMAFFLTGAHTHHAMPLKEAGGWKGLAIEGVQVELDPAASFSPERSRLVLGSLIRDGSALGIVANVPDRQGFYDLEVVPLINGLPEASDGLKAGFYKWNVVIREGDEKHILWQMDVTPPE